MTPHQRKIAAIVPELLKWFSENARDLPWRRTTDPYCVFVSEIMLQQTQVKTVVPYWERWMRSLPDIRALARATPGKLHKLWDGLGYYTRVRNMHKAARIIVDQHGGEFPRGFEELLELPGIGRYTAGAISSIAFNEPRPVLDGNVIRVLTRLFGIDGNPREPTTNATLWQLAEELVLQAATITPSAPRSTLYAPRSPPLVSAFNQSLMELGALVCTPRQPRCAACPVNRLCRARREYRVARLPNLGRRPRPTARHVTAFVVEHAGRFLVRQRPPGVVNAHLWEFPNSETAPSRAGARQAARAVLGFTPRSLEPLCSIKHSITRYRITLDAFCVTLPPGSRPSPQLSRWFPLPSLRRLPFAGAHKRILSHLAPAKKSRALRASRG